MDSTRCVITQSVLWLTFAASTVATQERVLRRYDASPLTRPAPQQLQPRTSLANLEFERLNPPWPRVVSLTDLEIESLVSFMVPPELWESDGGGSVELRADTLLLKHSPAVQKSFRRQLNRAIAILAPTWRVELVVCRKRPQAFAGLRGFRWLRSGEFDAFWKESAQLPGVVAREARRVPARRMPYVGQRDLWTFVSDFNVEVTKGNSIADPEVNAVTDAEGVCCGFLPGPMPNEATFVIRLLRSVSKRNGKIDVRISKEDTPKLHQIDRIQRRFAEGLSTIPLRSGDAFVLALHGSNAAELTLVMRVLGPAQQVKELQGDTLLLSHAVLSDEAFRQQRAVRSNYPRTGEGLEEEDYEPPFEQLGESFVNDLKDALGTEGVLLDPSDAVCVRGSPAVLRRVRERASSWFAPFSRAFVVHWIEEERDADGRWQDRLVRTCVVAHGRSAWISDSSEQNYVRDYNVEVGGGEVIADPVSDWVGTQRELSIQLDTTQIAGDARVAVKFEAIAQDLHSVDVVDDERFKGLESPRVTQRRFARTLRLVPGKRTLLGRGPTRIGTEGKELETRFSIQVEAVKRPGPAK